MLGYSNSGYDYLWDVVSKHKVTKDKNTKNILSTCINQKKNQCNEVPKCTNDAHKLKCALLIFNHYYHN